MCTCDLCFEEKYYFSSESLLYIAYACFCNILINQRTNGPVNAHLISWPSKAQNIETWKIYRKEITLTFKTHIPS